MPPMKAVLAVVAVAFALCAHFTPATAFSADVVADEALMRLYEKAMAKASTATAVKQRTLLQGQDLGPNSPVYYPARPLPSSGGPTPNDASVTPAGARRSLNAAAPRTTLPSPRTAPRHTTQPSSPTCDNANIKSVFTAKVAVLMTGTSGTQATVRSSDYVNLLHQRVQHRLDRYNKQYRLSLGYSATQKTTGGVQQGKQKWYYYDIQFLVGACGKYKQPLVAQLRGDIKASAPFIRRVRLLDYSFLA